MSTLTACESFQNPPGLAVNLLRSSYSWEDVNDGAVLRAPYDKTAKQLDDATRKGDLQAAVQLSQLIRDRGVAWSCDPDGRPISYRDQPEYVAFDMLYETNVPLSEVPNRPYGNEWLAEVMSSIMHRHGPLTDFTDYVSAYNYGANQRVTFAQALFNSGWTKTPANTLGFKSADQINAYLLAAASQNRREGEAADNGEDNRMERIRQAEAEQRENSEAATNAIVQGLQQGFQTPAATSTYKPKEHQEPDSHHESAVHAEHVEHREKQQKPEGERKPKEHHETPKPTAKKKSDDKKNE